MLAALRDPRSSLCFKIWPFVRLTLEPVSADNGVRGGPSEVPFGEIPRRPFCGGAICMVYSISFGWVDRTRGLTPWRLRRLGLGS